MILVIGKHQQKKLILGFGALLTAIFAGELIVRLLIQVPAMKPIEFANEDCVYRRSTNPVLGFELKQDYRNLSPDFIESYERTNSHGQRDNERTLAKGKNTRRVLLLGDSVVEGYGLSQEKTISSQLHAILANTTREAGASYGVPTGVAVGKPTSNASVPSIEVLNFGVSAYCTLAEIELLATKGVRFSPDDVVLVFVENDFDNFNREAFPLGGTFQRPKIVNKLFKHSHFFRLLCLQTNAFQFCSESQPVEWNQAAIGNNNVAVGIRRFRELADQYGFRPSIAIWPRFTNTAIANVHYIHGNDESLVVEALASHYSIPTFRLSDTFELDFGDRTEGNHNPRLLYSQGDGLHPNPLGARIAATALQQWLMREPGSLANVNNAAIAAQSLNQESKNQKSFDNARIVEAARQLGSAKPNYARVHNRVGNSLVEQGDYAKAIQAYRKALNEDPNNAVTYNNLGIALEKAKLSGAKQSFIEAVKRQPDFALAHFNLSRMLLQENKFSAAIHGLRQTLMLAPDHVGAMTLLGQQLAKRQELEEAQQLLARAAKLKPNDAEVLNNLGVVCAASGNLIDAIRYFESALQIDPTHQQAVVNLQNTRQGTSQQ